MKELRCLFLLSLFIFQITLFQGQESKSEWGEFPIFENTTKYSRTYVVNQNSKNACDTNSGTKDYPLLTINAALGKVKAGERVLIFSGVYRENLNLKNGGKAPDRMISIESISNHKVIIKGSNVFEGEWVQALDKNKSKEAIITQSVSSKLWITTLEDSFFDSGYYPFQTNNVEAKQLDSNSKLNLVKDIYPIELKTGMIFQNGKRMVQMHHYGDLVHVSGSFWVDVDNKTVHIHPFDNKNPNQEKIEISTDKYLLQPESDNVNYVQIKGLIFEHCANAFMGPESGAINTKGGKYWIFEDNEIREINGRGICIDKPLEIENATDSLGVGIGVNSHINIRNNKIYNCGVSGIYINKAENVLVKNNEIANCGWQESELLLNSGAIQLLQTGHALIENNYIHHMSGAAGICLFNNNEQIKVNRNIIYQLATQQGAIYSVFNQAENRFTNNFIWEVIGAGIKGNNSSMQQYLHNLVAYTSQQVICIENDRSGSGAKQNRVVNNLLIDFGQKMQVALGNEVDNNAFVFNTKIKDLEFKKWQKLLINSKGFVFRANTGFNSNTMMFKWNVKAQLKAVSYLSEVKTDFANEKRSETGTVPGPFRDLPANYDYYVSLTAQ